MNQKEMTMEELKSTIAETVNESELSNEVKALKDEMTNMKSSKSLNADERAEKSAEFVRDLVNGKLEKKTIGSGTSSFGYAIPVELANAIHEKKDKIAKIRKYAFVFSMDGKFDLPIEATGVTAYWVTTEADADLTESNPTVTKKSLDDFYLAARVRVPYKLMNSTPISIENYVSKLAARALRSTEETAFVAGDGDGKPTGLRVASITAVPQAAAAMTYDDIVNLYFSVPEQYRANGTWLVSNAAIKLIMKLKDENKQPIFDKTTQTIFNRPLEECTDIPSNLGSGQNETEIYFGDLSEYWIKDGENMMSETRQVPGRLQVDVIVYQAVDGVLVNTDAFRKLTGVK
jgi:HK97 family phage major capsid protein